MKHTIHLSTLFIFLNMGAFAQTYIPVSVKTTIFNCNNNGGRSEITDIDSLNVYNNIINRIEIASLNPDTTYTFYFYNSNQLRDSIVYKFKRYNKWFTSGFTNFQYDSNDTLINNITWNYQFNDTTIIDSSAYRRSRTYDQLNRTLHSEFSAYDSNLGWHNNQEYDTVYDIQNKIISLTTYFNFLPHQKQIISYFSNDSISNTFLILFSNGIILDTLIDVYSYNSIGRCDSISTYRWEQNTYSTPTYLRLKTYDISNRLKQSIGKTWSNPDSAWCNCQDYFDSYTYNSVGLLSDYYYYNFPSDKASTFYYNTSGELDSIYSCSNYFPGPSTTCCTTIFTTLLLPTSIDEFLSNNITIYPNPTSDKLNINFAGQNNKIDKITISDITGSVIYSGFSSIANNSLVIDISTFSEGMYFISFIYENQIRFTKKIIRS